MPSGLESARRYLALARAVIRARGRSFDPFKLTWILTERCSLRCGTCHLWATEPADGPDLETVRRVVAANRHLTWVNLSGGDFVERDDAPELVEAIVSGLPDLALLDFPTAGQDPKNTLRALEPALASAVPRVYVTVSLDGPDDVHDRVRGRRGAAAAARATLRRLGAIRRRGFRVVAGMTLSRLNVPETLDRPGRVLPPGIPVGDLHLNLAHHSPHYYRNSRNVAPPVASTLRLLVHVEQHRARRLSALGMLERRYWRLARRYLEHADVGGWCGALRASVYLAADLTVQPCTIFDRPLGNLADVDFALRRISEFPRAASALADVEGRRCPGCWSPCEAFPTLLVGLGKPL